MKVRVFWVSDYDTRITRNKFGFCKLLPGISEQNSGFGYFGFRYFGFGFRVTGFLPSSIREGRQSFVVAHIACFKLFGFVHFAINPCVLVRIEWVLTPNKSKSFLIFSNLI
jgi:hypothetical protein